MNEKRVDELMSIDPVSVRAEASALEAYELMLRHGIRHLPVLGAGSRVAGVISADDLAAALALPLRPRRPLMHGQREEALEHVVAEMMSYAPVTIRRDATPADAAARMAEGRIGCLPVVDAKGRLEGIVTETDLLYALAGQPAPEARERRKRDALAGLVSELESERARIAAELDRHHSVERELTHDTHERPMDMPELSAERDLVGLEASLDALAAKRLAALDRALDHARQGRLSVCDGCGGSISLPRLRALPGTTLCIACARAAEAG
jgi:CBS domain-containing protein